MRITASLITGCLLLGAASCKRSAPPGTIETPTQVSADTSDQASALPAQPEKIDIPFEHFRLKNGLKVILHRDNRLPLVAVSVWYDVGALNEGPKKSGFAHLFEHMMFQGSAHVGADKHFEILEKIGATGVNGTTSFDRTNYFETVPSNALEIALWLESDRMGFLLESLTEESLKNQIDVVKNERRQSIESQPYGLMNERIVQRLFQKPHPYYGNVIGSMDDLNSATLKDVRTFFKRYYHPANATLVLAGDIQPEAAKKWVKKYFGPLKRYIKRKRPNFPPLELTKEEVINFEEPVGRLAKLSIVWPMPNVYHQDSAALDLLSHILSGTRSSRLDTKVSYEDPLAQSVTAYYRKNYGGSWFQIDLVVQPDRTLDEALSAVDEVLAEFDKKPIQAAELHRAINARETGFLFGLERLGGMGGRAEILQKYNHDYADPSMYKQDIKRHREVTLKEVEQVRKTWLTSNRLVVKATPKQKENSK